MNLSDFFKKIAAINIIAALLIITPAAIEAAEPAQPAASGSQVEFPSEFKNAENLKYALKRLKNMFVSFSTNYNENDAAVKTFFSDLINCLGDCNISSMEEAGLAEALGEIIVKLKIMQDEEKRIYDQFVRIFDEAGIKRALSLKIVDNARDVAILLSKKKDGTAQTESIIYKYYGVEAKGHSAHKQEEKPVHGAASFFGTAEPQKPQADELINKYNDDSQDKKKKIIGIELMDPVAARENSLSRDGETKDKTDIEKMVKEKAGDSGAKAETTETSVKAETAETETK